jgi:mRNA interferase HigB
MNVISKKKIDDFCKDHAGAKGVLVTWYKKAVKAQWSNFAEIRQDYPSSDWVGDDRVVFNIGGNNYRVVARISFVYKNMMIKWIGTHAEYDSIDAANVS